MTELSFTMEGLRRFKSKTIRDVEPLQRIAWAVTVYIVDVVWDVRIPFLQNAKGWGQLKRTNSLNLLFLLYRRLKEKTRLFSSLLEFSLNIITLLTRKRAFICLA